MRRAVSIKRATDDEGRSHCRVRYWSVYRQQWVETIPACIPDSELAAMSPEDRIALVEAMS